MEATYESIYQTHLDYFHFKPWFYKHNRIKIKNLNEVEPKIILPSNIRKGGNDEILK